jgi:hypothetical protein
MTVLGLCVLAFGLTYWAGKRSLGWGVVTLFLWGYIYGIFRANFESAFSHFLFDAALLGLYLAQKSAFASPTDPKRMGTLRYWIFVLMLWPALLVLLPFQPLLISLVGLRGAILFLPMALLGSRMTREDLTQICYGLVCLNLMALAFGTAEYFQGVPTYYPYNAMTVIIYNSNDVAGGFLRIPGTFATAHQFGGTMAASIPYLMGGWNELPTRKSRLVMVLGLAAAFMGIIMSATRLNVILAALLVLAIVCGTRMKTSRRVLFICLILIAAAVAFNNERFERFKSLSDTDYVGDRFSGSVNREFFEILLEYPMGNGLGGGGTNIPYFLQGQVRNPIGLENEYARILCEQGIIGLLLWIAFIVWYLGRASLVFGKTAWATGRRLIWCYNFFTLALGMIGIGMLTSIPATAMLLLGIGWTSVAMPAEVLKRRPVSRSNHILPQQAHWPAHAN